MTEIKSFKTARATVTASELAQLRIASFAALKGWGRVREDGNFKSWDSKELRDEAISLTAWALGHPISCSFCGKDQHSVKKIIAGPSCFCCDECVALMADIIAEESKPEGAPKNDPSIT